MDLAEALKQLDPAVDDHWTADGLPRIDSVSALAGREVTRKEVTDVAPQLVRSTSGNATPGAEESSDNQFATQTESSAPLSDVPAFLSVPIVDSIMSTPFQEIIASVEKIDRAIAELARENDILSRRKAEIETRRNIISAQTTTLNRARAQLIREGRHKEPNPIQQYLKSTNKAREERAARTRKFIDERITPQDVAAALVGESKIDAALRNRPKQHPTLAPPQRR